MRDRFQRTALPLFFAAAPFVVMACSDGATSTGAPGPLGSGSASAPEASASASAAAPSASASASGPVVQAACALDESVHVDYDDFGKECGFVVPKSPSALPPRNNWEPCGAAIGLPGCKKLKLRQGASLSRVIAGAKRPDVVEIGYVEECAAPGQKHAQLVISEADGPTLAAFASKAHEPGKCDVDILSLWQGAYTAKLTDESGASGAGAFVGAPTQTSKPKVLFSWEPGKAELGAVTSDVRWVVYGPSGAKTARWIDDAPETITQSSLNVEPTLHHDEVFWADVDLFVVKTAAKPEKLFASDSTDAMSAAGTDGNHIVATHRGAGGKLTLVASPFALTADKVELSSVLPLPASIDNAPWTVGCGYAAHAAGKNQVLVVRLKDGVSWAAASPACDTEGLCLNKPLALTCKDIFFEATSKDDKNRTIARITHEGLGKGKPPASAPVPFGKPAGSAAPTATSAPTAQP
ncbi:MAG: hypothetical protein R3B70_04350 [Polyangiaceae bacterium]